VVHADCWDDARGGDAGLLRLRAFHPGLVRVHALKRRVPTILVPTILALTIRVLTIRVLRS
jgi:hypothetical protein